MKWFSLPLICFFAMLALGCGEKNTYKRNVDYLSDSFLNEERITRSARLEEALTKVQEATATGDQNKIYAAQAEYQIAWERLEIVVKQIKEREQKRNPTPRPAEKRND